MLNIKSNLGFLLPVLCIVLTGAAAKQKTETGRAQQDQIKIADYFRSVDPGEVDPRKLRAEGAANQISFKLTESAGSGTTFSEVDIGFFTSTDCTGTAANTVAISTSLTLGAKTFQSRDATNYLLCQQQSGSSTSGAICTPNSGINSIKFSYSYVDNALSANSTTAVQCLMNNNLTSPCTASNCGFTSSIPTINLTPLLIFVSISSSNGALSGTSIAKADSICQTEASSSLYNAAIVGSNSNGSACRQACTNTGSGAGNTNCGTGTNWVMQANQVYANYYDQSFLWLTNSAGVTDNFNFFTNAITQTDGGRGRLTWTGLNVDWTTNSSSCKNGSGTSWSSSSTSASGSVGAPFAASTGIVLHETSNLCTSFNNFYCVQQPSTLTSPTCS